MRKEALFKEGGRVRAKSQGKLYTGKGAQGKLNTGNGSNKTASDPARRGED